MQGEVDMLARALRREQSHLLEAERSTIASDEANPPDLHNLIAIRDSLRRQLKAMQDELQAMSHVLQSPF
jgi:hypothetical protein